MEKIKLIRFYFVHFIFHSMIFDFTFATSTTDSYVEESKNVWKTLVGLAQRVSILETKQNIYTEDRQRLTRLEMQRNIYTENIQQLFQYLEVITETVKEQKEMNHRMEELTNIVTEMKSKMAEQITEIAVLHNQNNKTLSNMIQKVKNNIEEQTAGIIETHNQDNKTLCDMVQRVKYDVGNESMINQQQTNQQHNFSSTMREIRTYIQQTDFDYQQKINDLNQSIRDTNERIQTLNVNISLLQSQEQDRPVDCTDVYKQGYQSNGVYTIYPTGNIHGYWVYCDMTTDGGGWTVFQRRFNGSVDFYRTWNEYMNGFGDVNGEYWLGNEKIHELTSQMTQTLRIDVMDQAGIWKYAVYDGFSISDNSNGYRLSAGAYHGNAGDSLAHQVGSMFETKDHQRSKNCATRFTGAWWYNACHHSNLNGLYNNTEFGKGMNWYHWHGHTYSMKATEMKIRRLCQLH